MSFKDRKAKPMMTKVRGHLELGFVTQVWEFREVGGE